MRTRDRLNGSTAIESGTLTGFGPETANGKGIIRAVVSVISESSGLKLVGPGLTISIVGRAILYFYAGV